MFVEGEKGETAEGQGEGQGRRDALSMGAFEKGPAAEEFEHKAAIARK